MTYTPEDLQRRIELLRKCVVVAQDAANDCQCPKARADAQRRVTRLVNHLGATIIKQICATPQCG